MTLKTVSWIASEANEWKGDKGTTYFVNVKFADGDSGSLGKRDAAKAEEVRKLLEGLKDTEAEFGLDDSGKKTDDGNTKWRIKSFPGYEPEPYSGGGGGKRDYVPRFVDTDAGWRESDERVDRRRSLELAVQFAAGVTGGLDSDETTWLASNFYDFLRATSDSGTASSAWGAPQTERGATTAPSVPESDASPSAVIGSAGGAESGSGVANEDGEDSEAVPDPGQLPHAAVWIQSPKVKSMVVCEVPRCVLHPARRKDEAVSV